MVSKQGFSLWRRQMVGATELCWFESRHSDYCSHQQQKQHYRSKNTATATGFRFRAEKNRYKLRNSKIGHRFAKQPSEYADDQRELSIVADHLSESATAI